MGTSIWQGHVIARPANDAPSERGQGPVKDHRRIALIVLAVAALVAAGVMAWPHLQPPPGPATEFNMVCVATGEVFVRTIEQAPMIPAAHPRTGARTLVPCTREPDGTVRITERYADAVRGELADVNRAVDLDTLLVKSPE
jgi:hypothetical protein